MRLELNHLKHFPKSSKESNCYEAQLFVDGKRIAFCTNAGKGGSTNIQPYFKDIEQAQQKWDVLRAAEEFCKAMPPREIISGLTIKMNLEAWVELEVERQLSEKYEIKDRRRLQRTMEKEIVFLDTRGEMKLRGIPGVPWTPDLLEEMDRVFPGCIVLNALPLEEAMRYYMA